MGDIKHTFDGYEIIFTAYTNKGHQWMQDNFGTDKISYDPRRERDEAVQFFAQAENEGLIVDKSK